MSPTVAVLSRASVAAGRGAVLPQIVVAVVCGGYATGSLLGWGSPLMAAVMGDFGLSAAALLAGVSCLGYARTQTDGARAAWRLFALSSFTVATGNAVWGWYEVVLRAPVPDVSVADFVFLLFAPPAIIGVPLLAKRPRTRLGWACLVLDSWLIAGSLLTLSWSLALANAADGRGDPVRAGLALAYPLLDIVLVSVVLALHFRRSSFNRAAVHTALAALALTILCDALFTLTTQRDGYRSGQLLDAGWFTGSMLLACAPWVDAAERPGTDRSVRKDATGPPGTAARSRPHHGRRYPGGRRTGRRPARGTGPRPMGRRSARPRGGTATAVPGTAPPPPGPDGPARTLLDAPARTHVDAPARTVPGDPLRPVPGGALQPVPDGVPAARGEGRTVRAGGSLAALTPYISAAVCTLGILYSVLAGRQTDRVVLFTAGMVVLALVARQGIMLLDNVSLTQELARQERHFRSLVQGSSDVIMIAAPDGVLRYVSPASRGVYGRAADDLVGTGLAEMIHPDDRGRALCEIRRFLAAPPAREPATRIECRIRSGGGTWLNVESAVNRYRDGLIFNSRDVTERVRLQAQLQHSASHDPLTDLPNRALYTERVRRAVGGRRSDDGAAAVFFIDLDGFKAVNDSVGHQAGDELLVHVARRLREAVRAGDTVARFGGDEFAALVCGGSADRREREEQVRDVADRLRTALSRPYRIDGDEVRVEASIGIAFAEPGMAPDELMRNADLAMYRAKSSGKGRVEVYAPQMQADAARRAELAGRLRRALDEGEFTLFHQPVADLASGAVAAVEAQARWRSAQDRLFTPAEFLRMASDADQTAELSRWVVEEAVGQAAARHRAGRRVPVAVRIPAARLLEQGPPAQSVEAVIARHGLPAGGLILMLGEYGPGDLLDRLERRLAGLRRAGVRVALDTFGTGHGSLHALRRLPVDILKIDRSFVEGVRESPRLRKITTGMIRIAADLGVATIADGVDVPEQALALRSMGCTHAQGKAFSGPLDGRRLNRALSRGLPPVPYAEVPPGVVRHSAVPAGQAPAARSVRALPGCPSPRPDSETSVPPA